MSVSVEAPTRRGGPASLDRERVGPDRTANAVRQGPLLAMCGLAGGAGTTTLAYLVALAAARQLREPALAADTGGPTASLVDLAGVEAPRSLPELAAQLATSGTVRGGLYAKGPHGVRILASGRQFTSSCPVDQLRRVLRDAREAHGLTVVDCGTLGRDIDRAAAATATHLAWVMPATELGASRAARMLAATPHLGGMELLIARREARQRKAPLSDLSQLAAMRGVPLVLVPHLAALEAGRVDRAAQEAQVAIQAILGALSR